MRERSRQDRPWAVALAGLGLSLAAPVSGESVLPLPGALGSPAAAPGPAKSRAQAETCLAQAISYEAGLEPEAGQEAVAQVVLNRLHHPSFPKTVCGVVFQGSQRRTGCQFTFTCDGSMIRRRPVAWDNALRIARLALDGQLVSSVGDATHYHAFYVSPAWSGQLTRVGRIGAHIFYSGVARGVTAVIMAGNQAQASGTPGVPQPTVFSAWGLRTAVLIPTAGSVRVETIAAANPIPAGARAIPPRAPDMADPPTR